MNERRQKLLRHLSHAAMAMSEENWQEVAYQLAAAAKRAAQIAKGKQDAEKNV